MLFIQAKNCGPARPAPIIKWIVIHTMQAPEKPYTARAVAHWGASDQAPKASWHFAIDSIEVIQCVREDVVAWGAPGANRYGIHLEHAGYAEQTPDKWHDDYSRACLARSADLARELCIRYGIPAVHLTPEEIVAGKKGFCGHIDVTVAFNHGKGHTDPGAWFPWDEYLAMVRGSDPDPVFPKSEPPTESERITELPPETPREGTQKA